MWKIIILQSAYWKYPSNRDRTARAHIQSLTVAWDSYQLLSKENMGSKCNSLIAQPLYGALAAIIEWATKSAGARKMLFYSLCGCPSLLTWWEEYRAIRFARCRVQAMRRSVSRERSRRKESNIHVFVITLITTPLLTRFLLGAAAAVVPGGFFSSSCVFLSIK